MGKKNVDFVGISKSAITKLIKELTLEVEKINNQNKDDILVNCDGIVTEINSRIAQLKNIKLG